MEKGEARQPPEGQIVVVGGANFDYLARGPKLPEPGETVQGDLFQEAPGGKGANQAVAAARFGLPAALVARIGNDARGQAIQRVLGAEGVATDYLITDEHAPTGIALILVGEKGEKEILAAPGANRQFQVRDVKQAASLIQSARVLLTQLETPLETVQLAVRLAHQAGVQVILDPAPAIPLPDELLHMVDVIKPNATEAQILTGTRPQDRDSARAAARQLLERGVGAVAIQVGAEGDLLVTAENEYWLPHFPVESIDATGAGDAFAAALAVAVVEGRGWADAGTFASAAAALTTTKLGAQAALPSREDILQLLAQSARRRTDVIE